MKKLNNKKLKFYGGLDLVVRFVADYLFVASVFSLIILAMVYFGLPSVRTTDVIATQKTLTPEDIQKELVLSKLILRYVLFYLPLIYAFIRLAMRLFEKLFHKLENNIKN